MLTRSALRVSLHRRPPTQGEASRTAGAPRVHARLTRPRNVATDTKRRSFSSQMSGGEEYTHPHGFRSYLSTKQNSLRTLPHPNHSMWSPLRGPRPATVAIRIVPRSCTTRYPRPHGTCAKNPAPWCQRGQGRASTANRDKVTRAHIWGSPTLTQLFRGNREPSPCGEPVLPREAE